MMLTEYRIPLYQWDDPNLYPPRKRAELRAYFALKGMVDVIEEHYRAQREEKERQRKDAKQPQQKSLPAD